MPGPGSGIPEHEFKRRHEQARPLCDICEKRPATNTDGEPKTCDECHEELRKKEA